jgi:hypothetical protein
MMTAMGMIAYNDHRGMGLMLRIRSIKALNTFESFSVGMFICMVSLLFLAAIVAVESHFGFLMLAKIM